MGSTFKHKDRLEQNKGLLMQISIISSLLIVLMLFESKSKSAEMYPNSFTEISLEIQEQGRTSDILPPDPGTKNQISEVKSERLTASFPGGNEALNKYMKEHMQYSDAALKKDIQGRVIVSFTVDQRGKIKDVKVIRSIHPLIDTEALRLIKNMPKWKPAEKFGEPVSTRQVLPVIFINNNSNES